MIPETDMPKTYAFNDFDDSKFLEIKSNDLIIVDLKYPKMNLKSAINRCFVRDEVFHKIITASEMLPRGFKFKIFDIWRPLSLQRELYSSYSRKIIAEQNLKSLPENERDYIIKQYISKPRKSKILPPVHITGGAVDLTITDKNGNELNMGTDFDSFSPKAHTSYFEKNCFSAEDEMIRDNRRLLYDTMVSVGFTNLPSEWWHYDYGDRFWAFYNNLPAKYDGVFELEDIYEKL